ncbi:MAG: SDR family NAD(P)-dependent oxidoreductase, partial [Bryobacteraceae bacterium]
MRKLDGKVAVVTGAASGIGRALAERFAREGMRLALADIDAARLEAVAERLGALAVVTDVSRRGDVEALAARTVEKYSVVDVVCNNAGVVSPPNRSWQKPLAQWEAVLGANLWGVIHGVRAFVPLLLAQDREAHIVNTASGAGLLSGPFAADYMASKHAVISLSESLKLELEAMGAKVKVSVLCPGYVRTSIVDESRRRFGPAADAWMAMEEENHAAVASATPPEKIAELVVTAIREERFAILPHPEIGAAAEARLRALL